MKVLQTVFTLLLVTQSINAFQDDPPEKIESIIKEQPWYVQVGLTDGRGFALRPDFNYSLSVGKYLNENYSVKVGLTYGNNITDRDAISEGEFITSSVLSSDIHLYGFDVETLYNFFPHKRLQFSTGIFTGYVISKTERSDHSESDNGTSFRKYDFERKTFSFGLTQNISFFVHRNIAFYIQNRIIFNIHHENSYSEIEFHPGSQIYKTTSKSERKTLNFDNLLLGVGMYF